MGLLQLQAPQGEMPGDAPGVRPLPAHRPRVRVPAAAQAAAAAATASPHAVQDPAVAAVSVLHGRPALLPALPALGVPAPALQGRCRLARCGSHLTSCQSPPSCLAKASPPPL